MNLEIKKIHNELGITEEHIVLNKLKFFEEAPLEQLEIVAIDFEGKPFIIKKSTAKSWRSMQSHAKSEGINLNPYSGFSEHHSGCAIDIYADSHCVLEEAFEKTTAFNWLIENAEKYRFRMSYPRDNKFGIIYEPWHWYYIDEK